MIKDLKKEFEKNRLLFVEGEDDRRFFSKMSEKLELRKSLGIITLGGVTEWKVSLLSYIKSIRDNHNSIAFIRDADNDPLEAFNETRKVFLESISNNSPLKASVFPEYPESFSSSFPRIGVYILPTKNETGSLEDLCLQYFKKEKQKFPCAEEFFQCLKQKSKEKKTHENKKKLQSILLEVELQSYLSSLENNFSFAYTPGEATKKGYIDCSNDIFEDLKNFLLEFAK